MEIIFDIETDGLNATKIYVLSYFDGQSIKSVIEYEDMKEVLYKADKLIGHNIIRFDIPVLERLLNIDLSKKYIIDTLGLSWYLYPNRKSHSLESFGEKVKIDDWENLDLFSYINRCESDVLLTQMVYERMMSYLEYIYEGKTNKIISYLNFKLSCLQEQEKHKIKLDIEKVEKYIKFFEEEKQKKIEILSSCLPKDKKGKIGNPNSVAQLKDWLYSLGWIPDTFTKSTKGKQVPQIYNAEKTLTQSVRDLIEKHPEVETLESLLVIGNRLGTLKNFLKLGFYAEASASKLTNTLRLRHINLVNLPKVTGKKDFRDGEYIRGCITCEEDEIMCGFDIVSLEDNTKQHYMYFHDPEYVKQVRVPGYDPHLAMAKFAGFISEEEENFYKWYDSRDKDHVFTSEEKAKFKELKNIRHKAKTTNFSAIYGVGVKKLSDTSKIPIEQAKVLLELYWKRNKSVLLATKNFNIKELDNDTMWILNPVSKLYYNLRYKKDAFSTVNQSTGVFVFDTLLSIIRKKFPIRAQFHDEGVIVIKKEEKEELIKHLQESVKELNKKLKLNVPIEISFQFGKNYAEIH